MCSLTLRGRLVLSLYQSRLQKRQSSSENRHLPSLPALLRNNIEHKKNTSQLIHDCPLPDTHPFVLKSALKTQDKDKPLIILEPGSLAFPKLITTR